MSDAELLESFTAQKKEIELQILQVQCRIYEAFKKELDTKSEGVFNFVNGNYKVKITKKNNVSVDQSMAESVGMAFKKKYSFNKTMYKSLTDEQKNAVDDCLTTKPSKPTFAVEKMEE